MRYLHFSVGVFFKLLYFLMVQCGGWVLASLHNPVLMRTYALGFFEGVFYSEYLHSIIVCIMRVERTGCRFSIKCQESSSILMCFGCCAFAILRLLHSS